MIKNEKLEALMNFPADFLSAQEINGLSAVQLQVAGFYQSAIVNGHERPAHGFYHAEATMVMAAAICHGENLPPYLPLAAAICLDLGRNTIDRRAETPEHGQVSAEMAKKMFQNLSEQNYFTPGQVTEMLNAISTHPLKEIPENLRTATALVTQDADKLAGYGALMIGRVAQHRHYLPTYDLSRHTASTEETKLKTLRDDLVRVIEWTDPDKSMFNTKTSKEIAMTARIVVRDYLEQLDYETQTLRLGIAQLHLRF